MKFKYIFLFFISISLQTIGQISFANHFPTMKPHHILDEKKQDISFAFGMRILESDYTGPLIKLRRASDNLEADFYATDKDILDLDAVNTFAGGNTLHVVTWYDQSGLARNAVQPDLAKQPVFTPDISFPHFNSDFSEDFLVVETSIQTLTNNGKNGTVTGVFFATNDNNHTFGVRDNTTGTNRWLAHLSWSTSALFFDPGTTAPGRRIDNTPNINLWKQYTLSRRDVNTDDEILFRINATAINNATYNDSNQITGDYNFGIGATISGVKGTANEFDIFGYSTTKFCEFIMYAEGKEDSFLQEIEDNQIIFWGL